MPTGSRLHRGTTRALTLLLLILLLAGCGGATNDAEAPPALQQAFAARLDSLATAAGLPGANAAFRLADGRIGAAAFGLADSTTGRVMTPGTRMLAGSIGKTWVAGVVVQLAHEGVLDLDAPVSSLLGDRPWFDRLPNGPDLTLRLLMNHDSGMPDHLDQQAYLDDVRALVAPGADPDATIAHEALIGYVLDLEPLHPAGRGFRYTDTNYILAGLAIEAATGHDYDDLMRERLAAPLGLTATEPQRRTAAGLACGHTTTDNVFGLPPRLLADDGFMTHNPAIEWTGGGVVSTPRDLVRWAALLWGGKLPGAGDYLPELLRGPPQDPDDPSAGRYGLAVFIDETDHGARLSHTGWYPGYHSMVAYWPDAGVAVALQINRDHDTQLREIHAALAELLL